MKWQNILFHNSEYISTSKIKVILSRFSETKTEIQFNNVQQLQISFLIYTLQWVRKIIHCEDKIGWTIKRDALLTSYHTHESNIRIIHHCYIIFGIESYITKIKRNTFRSVCIRSELRERILITNSKKSYRPKVTSHIHWLVTDYISPSFDNE